MAKTFESPALVGEAWPDGTDFPRGPPGQSLWTTGRAFRRVCCLDVDTCICICVCVYMYISIYVCVYIYIHRCICIIICVCICMYVQMLTQECMLIYLASLLLAELACASTWSLQVLNGGQLKPKGPFMDAHIRHTCTH